MTTEPHEPTGAGHDPDPYGPKYHVRRADGRDQPGGPHHGCELFTLDLRHDPHARAAARAYIVSGAQARPALTSYLAAVLGDLDAHVPIEGQTA